MGGSFFARFVFLPCASKGFEIRFIFSIRKWRGTCRKKKSCLFYDSCKFFVIHMHVLCFASRSMTRVELKEAERDENSECRGGQTRPAGRGNDCRGPEPHPGE